MALTSEVAGVCTVKCSLGCLPHRPVPLPEAPAALLQLDLSPEMLPGCLRTTRDSLSFSVLLPLSVSAQRLHLACFTTSLGSWSFQ